MRPDTLRPLSDQDINALERAAYQRGDVELAQALAFAADADFDRTELEYRPLPEDLADAEHRAEVADRQAENLKTAADAAYELLLNLKQRIAASKRVPKAELLNALSEVIDALVIPE